MTSLTLDSIDITADQSITLSYSKKANEWWAVLWREKGDIVLLAREGSTPIAALGELLVAMNASCVKRPL
ncbi:MAG: hypothetical protein WCS75_01380 [Sphingomonas sp.]|jgi:hypothetical protein|uniref:hypothetical protein n=1 Tax=Sphingomonas sp. TaxID=28214 RepID=UPI003567B823